MYLVVCSEKKGKVLDKKMLKALDGFMMTSRRGFKVNGELVRNVEILNKKLANGVVTKQVLKKYNRLVLVLTELLISDDDSDDTFREALNQIEKFRLEVKNKYREFLKKRDLEMMSKRLMILKNEADRRLIEINDTYLAMKNNGKGK